MKSTAEISTKKASTNTTRAARLHVIPSAEGWTVRRTSTGAEEPNRAFRTQNEAVEAARRAAGRDADVVIHNRNGRVRHVVSNSPADDAMLDYWKNLHAESSTGKNKVRKVG